MIGFFTDRARSIFCLLLVLFSVDSPVQSRTWSRSPTNLAQDYSIINDNRGGGDVVIVIWLTPPILASGISGQAAREILDKYVVIGVVHGQASKDGTFTTDKTATLEVNDESGQKLTALNADTMPPAVVGVLATMQSAFARAIGAVGQGVQWFAFDGAATHACTKGGITVIFAGEKYTYDTPIPGCP